MAVKHDMVAESQTSASTAQAQQNVQNLQKLLRVVRQAEPSTLDSLCAIVVQYLCQTPNAAVADKNSVKQINEMLTAYIAQLSDLFMDAAIETKQAWVNGCLKALHRQMVSTEGTLCGAAATILDLFNSTNIPSAVQWMLGNGNGCDQNSSDEALIRVFATLTQWLIEATVVESTPVWMCALLAGLRDERRFDLLLEITLGRLHLLMDLVKIPVLRARVLAVLQRMLVCDGRAPKVFHVMLPRLGDIIKSGKGQVHEQEILFLKTIQDLLTKFPDKDNERYKEIVSTRWMGVCRWVDLVDALFSLTH